MEKIIEACPRCDEELLDDVEQKFCQCCGFNVAEPNCVKCAAKLPDDEIAHCPYCGQKQ